MRTILSIALLSLSLAACATPPPLPPPPSLNEIIEISQDADGDPGPVYARIRESRAVYELDTEDVLRLHEGGVDHALIDDLLEQHRHFLRRESRYASRVWGGVSFYPGYWGPGASGRGFVGNGFFLAPAWCY